MAFDEVTHHNQTHYRNWRRTEKVKEIAQRPTCHSEKVISTQTLFCFSF